MRMSILILSLFLYCPPVFANKVSELEDQVATLLDVVEARKE